MVSGCLQNFIFLKSVQHIKSYDMYAAENVEFKFSRLRRHLNYSATKSRLFIKFSNYRLSHNNT